MSACDSVISPPPAQPLQDARAHELRQRLREPARERAEREHAERHEKHVAPPRAIAQPSVHRHDRRRREQVAHRDPRRVAQSAERRRDRRRRRREQRLVHRRHEHRQEHRDKKIQELRARYSLGRTLGPKGVITHLHTGRPSGQPKYPSKPQTRDTQCQPKYSISKEPIIRKAAPSRRP
jgi:hypothetical protein